jgi:uncharacterized protein YkwD
VKEVVNQLNSMKKSKKLLWSDSLAKAAQDHANDIGPVGKMGHVGTCIFFSLIAFRWELLQR